MRSYPHNSRQAAARIVALAQKMLQPDWFLPVDTLPAKWGMFRG